MLVVFLVVVLGLSDCKSIDALILHDLHALALKDPRELGTVLIH